MRLMLSLSLALGCLMSQSHADSPANALDFKVDSIDGKSVDLSDYKGRVVLVVNTASRCGLTDQYGGLQNLYTKFKDKGLVVLGFPCNQFAQQEPGSNAEIKEFCSTEYRVTFPMFGKVDVNGGAATPFYQHLTSQETKPDGKGPIGWNFAKFVISRDGQVSHRFSPNTAPDDTTLVSALEDELAKKVE